jgi:hypothetical protein
MLRWEMKTCQGQGAQGFISLLASLIAIALPSCPCPHTEVSGESVLLGPNKKPPLWVISSCVGFAGEAGQQADPEQLQVLSFLWHPANW